MKKKQAGKSARYGWGVMLFMLTFQLSQLLSPRLASYLAYSMWFHPGRASAKKIPDYRPSGVIASSVQVNNKRVCYWCAGQGEAVFLMHGWAGCGKQMATLAQAFIDNGYKVIWMDAPAHGQSSGWQTSLFEISEAMSQVQHEQGDFTAVVAHSFGVPCTLYAMSQLNLKIDKLIAIASPATTEGLVDKFCRMIKANQQTFDFLKQRIAHFLGDIDLSEIAAITMAQNVEEPVLLIHDKQDRIVDFSEGQLLQQNFRHAYFVGTEKLGHNKILKDPLVVKQCIDFISQDHSKLSKAEKLAV